MGAEIGAANQRMLQGTHGATRGWEKQGGILSRAFRGNMALPTP